MPPNTITVTRPSMWGNPFATAEAYRRAWNGASGRAELERWFRSHKWVGPVDREMVKQELGGKNLACWCGPGAACHADVLLELANAE